MSIALSKCKLIWGRGFRKIKGRISKVIDLDATEDAKLLAKIDEAHANMEEVMQSPLYGVC